MTATTWWHLATGQGLKLRQKKGFREEIGLRNHQHHQNGLKNGCDTRVRGQLWAGGCPCPGWLLVKFSPFWGLAQKKDNICISAPSSAVSVPLVEGSSESAGKHSLGKP